MCGLVMNPCLSPGQQGSERSGRSLLLHHFLVPSTHRTLSPMVRMVVHGIVLTVHGYAITKLLPCSQLCW
ncbi:hypothetical protein E2C01_015226 [Portunus trituberculatus]|uniref:Uncharacterized protein n=1 Tax=Portunus trituberculatus TaxID=210409 RepID=A0A5B7DM05_PORTR|nr:hypothetical protein [Portunus trituberculatus]